MTRRRKETISYLNLVLLVPVILAVIWDIKTWRIPNELIAIGMLTGLGCSVAVSGLKAGLISGTMGCGCAVVLLFIFFFIGAMGGGDIKLCAMVGCFVGTSVGYIIIYSFISGGVLSIIYILKNHYISNLFHGIIPRLIRNTKDTVVEDEHKGRIHFSIAILAGCIIYFVKTYLV